MNALLLLDREAIAHACVEHGVLRLRIFGSATSDRFDPSSSDLDFLVTFSPDVPNHFHAYFDFKDALEEITGRSVDLVEESAIRNPFFARSAYASAEDLYAA
ncbi:MAG: nucleotidyltransferase domain-containing protein [Nocardioides sp.]|uniref:nucleotidyltransferase family protein n=1 Tax=Nocardioides sp. TaxID=35761 RepID=UPI0039E48BDF